LRQFCVTELFAKKILTSDFLTSSDLSQGHSESWSLISNCRVILLTDRQTDTVENISSCLTEIILAGVVVVMRWRSVLGSRDWSADGGQSAIQRSSISRWSSVVVVCTTEPRRGGADVGTRRPRLAAAARRRATHSDTCRCGCCARTVRRRPRMRAQPHRQALLHADVLLQLR